MRTYCRYCGEQCDIVRETAEQYPGQYLTIFVSKCCGEGVVDDFNQSFKYGELATEYETRRSYEI